MVTEGTNLYYDDGALELELESFADRRFTQERCNTFWAKIWVLCQICSDQEQDTIHKGVKVSFHSCVHVVFDEYKLCFGKHICSNGSVRRVIVLYTLQAAFYSC